MDRFIRSLLRHSKLFLSLFGVLLIVSGIFAPGLLGSLKNGGWEDKKTESYLTAAEYEKSFPNLQVDGLIILRSSHYAVADPQFQAAADTITTRLLRDTQVSGVTSYYSTNSDTLISKDHKSAILIVSMKGDTEAKLATATRLHDKLQIPTFTTLLGGIAFTNYQVNEQVKKDISKAESIAIPILVVLLLFVFRSVVAASLPLLVGLSSVLGAFALTRAIASVTDVSVYAANVINFLSLGLAVDYSLLMVSRFREELQRQNSVTEAIERTLASAGKTILFSGSIVSLSMLSLLLFPQLFLRSMGIGGVISVLISLLLALVVLPLILKILGHRINKWTLPIPAFKRERGLFWQRIALFVMRYPVPVLVISFGFILLLASPVRHIELGYPTASSMPKSFQARQVDTVLATDFPQINAAPMDVLIKNTHGTWSTQDITALSSYVTTLRKLPNVATVTSPTDAGIPAVKTYLAEGTTTIPQADALIGSQLHGDKVLLQVNYRGSSIGDSAQDLIAAIRNSNHPSFLKVSVGGLSAQFVDLLGSLKKHLPLALAVIAVSTFVLMSLLLGSFVLPLKALILNVISLSAAFGVMVWVFQYGHFAGLLDLASIGTIDALQLILIFTIAFGLAMDYEVFLVSRIKEFHTATHEARQAVALGLKTTGPIITSAALLLVVVIGAFATGEVPLIKQTGVGLAAGVLLDATIVRALIVPATMELLGKYNWWAPRFWRKFAARFAIHE